MSTMKQALVVGASIAGPTTAYWLARAGWQVTCIERWPYLREAGQNVDIRTTGVTVMQKMTGMEAAVRSKLLDLEGLRAVRQDGSAIATFQTTGDANQQSLVSEFEIFRGDLSKILYDMTNEDPNIKYVFNEQVTAMHRKSETDADDGPITVDFMNGHPSATYDLVIACDGSTSRTRAIGLNCGARDYIEPVYAWAAYCSLDEDLLKGSKVGEAFNLPGGLFLALGPDPGRSANRAAMISVHSRKDPKAMEPFRVASKSGQDALKKYVFERFSSMLGTWKHATPILEAAMKCDDFYASELVQIKVPSLSKGRFVLVGDAGYGPGPTGAGTSLAIGGAYVLAGEICSHGDDIAAGLRAYETRMKPIIADMQKIPPGIPAAMAPLTVWGLRFRNFVLRTISVITEISRWFPWVGKLAGRISGMFASSLGRDKYGLPEYKWVR